MKQLIMGWLAVWLAGAAVAQTLTHKPILPTRAHILPSGVVVATNCQNGLLLARQTPNGHALVLTDTLGRPRWSQTVASLAGLATTGSRLAWLEHDTTQTLRLSLTNVGAGDRPLWSVEAGEGQAAAVTIQADGSVVVAVGAGRRVLLRQFTATGHPGWEQPLDLPRPLPGVLATATDTPGLLALPDGGLVLTVGGTVLGLDRAGAVRWQFGVGPDQVQWTQRKLLRNGQVLLVGRGVAAAFNPDNVDGRVLTLDPVTGQQHWLKTLGDPGTKEAAVDALDEPDGTVLVLLQETDGASVLRINARQEARFVGGLPLPAGSRCVALLALGEGRYGAVTTRADPDPGTLLTWGAGRATSTTAPRPALLFGQLNGPALHEPDRPNFYGLAVGVRYASLRYVGADPRAPDLNSRDFPDTYVMVASQPGQMAYEDPAWQHGAFTKALLDGLAGAADTDADRQLRLTELFAYLSEAVPALVRNQKQKQQQPAWLFYPGDAVLLLR